MKIHLFLLLAFNICACSNSTNKENVLSTSVDNLKTKELNQKVPSVTFKNTEGQAILIGDKIELLDQDLKPIEDISNLSREIVEIKGVSDSLFNLTKEICNAYWYVRIKTGDKEGIVNGRQVYKIINSNQDTSILINGSRFEILTTEFFGMGVEYLGDLMGCPVDQPILIRDGINGFFGLVSVIQNDIYNEAVWNHDFSFFQLRNDDVSYDKIVSIIPTDSNIRLKIHRIFQEGENDYEVLLKFDHKKYTAEYLNYGEIKYE